MEREPHGPGSGEDFDDELSFDDEPLGEGGAYGEPGDYDDYEDEFDDSEPGLD